MFSCSSRSGDGRVVGQHHRARVRHGHRHGPHRHGEPHPELLDHGAHREGERLPVRVGLRTVQQEVRRAEAVVVEAHDQTGRLVVLVAALREGHRRAPRPVVVERVDVEAGDHPPRRLGQQLLRREGRRVAGVEEPLQRVDQHRALLQLVELGHVVDDVHVPRRLCHRFPLMLAQPRYGPHYARSGLRPRAPGARPAGRRGGPGARRADAGLHEVRDALPRRHLRPAAHDLPDDVRRAPAARPGRLGVLRARAVGRRDLPRGALRGDGADPAPALPGAPGPGDARPLPAPGRVGRLVGLRGLRWPATTSATCWSATRPR